MDVKNLNASRVLLVTDRTIAKLPAFKTAVKSMEKAGVVYDTYDRVVVEPTDKSFNDIISFARKGNYDAFVAVGGGSVMDTCKAANLYACYPEADLLDFVNAPIGKGLPILKPLKPLVAVPTTAGTGSETTGVSIFDYTPLGAKTGIANRMIRPLLGIVDPENMQSMPKNVAAASGADVLCHALESYTAIPFQRRGPAPANPALRPAYQGANPISDVWSLYALDACSKYYVRSVEDRTDVHAQEMMSLASAAAGVGFGNAGVHLPHGMSYPISGLNTSYWHPEYDVDKPLVPHGVSVILSAPAVFRFTGPSNPDRHIEAARILGADVTNAKPETAGHLLADQLVKIMERLGVPDGLSGVGYDSSHLDALVEGTLPQKRVTSIAPSPVGAEELHRIFEDGLTVY